MLVHDWGQRFIHSTKFEEPDALLLEGFSEHTAVLFLPVVRGRVLPVTGSRPTAGLSSEGHGSVLEFREVFCSPPHLTLRQESGCEPRSQVCSPFPLAMLYSDHALLGFISRKYRSGFFLHEGNIVVPHALSSLNKRSEGKMQTPHLTCLT